MARSDGEACVQIFFVRSGKLIGREYFILEGTEEEQDEEILSEFVKQFYAQAAFVPQNVLLPKELEEAQIIKQWLNMRRGGEKVEICLPTGEQSKDLVDIATENAVETLRLRTRWQADKDKQHEALGEIRWHLAYPSAQPHRML